MAICQRPGTHDVAMPSGMRRCRSACLGVFLWGISLPAIGNTPDAPLAASEADIKPYPLDYFARRAVIGNVRVSPDGARLALMKIPSRKGDPVIEVYDAADLGKEPFRMNADPMEITYFRWVSDTDILFDLRQQVRKRIEGFNRGTYEYRLGLVNVETRKLKSFDEYGIYLQHRLPRKPNKIIVSLWEGGEDGPAAKVDQAFRPRSYHELDLKRGTKELLIRGTWAGRQRQLRRRRQTLAGARLRRRIPRAHLVLAPAGEQRMGGVPPRAPGRVRVLSVCRCAGRRTRTSPATRWWSPATATIRRALWSYDLANGEFGEAIYRRDDVDVGGTIGHTNRWQHPNTATGLWYITDRTHLEYFDAR